jgi:hypothetical protein
MAFCILISGSSWLAFNVAISTSFGLLYSKVWHLQNFVLLVKDCNKSAFFREFLQQMFSVDTRSRRQRRVAIVVFKASFGGGVCKYPFSFMSLQCDVQAPRYFVLDGQKYSRIYKITIFSFAEIKLYYKLWLYLKTFKEILKSYYHVTFNPSIRKTNAWDLYI